MAVFVFIIILHDRNLYFNGILFFIFMILLLGQRGVWLYPVHIPGYIPPIASILFYIIFIAFLIKYRLVSIKFTNYPFYKIIIVFFILFLFAMIRGLFDSGDLLRYLRSFIVYSSTGLIFFVIFYLKKNKSIIKKFFIIYNFALLVISIVYILIAFFNIHIEGSAQDPAVLSGERIVWGGQGPWIPTIMLINYFSLRFMKSKIYIVGLIILGFMVTFLSQTRNMVSFLILPMLFVYIRRSIGTTIIRISMILLFLLLIYTIFFSSYIGIDDKIKRFITYDDILIDDANELGNLTYYDAPHKLKPLLWSIHETRNIYYFLFGHGFGFMEYSGRTHFHSGLGWVYGSMGIIGIIIMILLLIKIIKYYGKYIDYKNGDLNSIIIEVILAYFVVLAIISPFTGLLIQEFSIFMQGLLLAILEVSRRNIINKQFIYRI